MADEGRKPEIPDAAGSRGTVNHGWGNYYESQQKYGNPFDETNQYEDWALNLITWIPSFGWGDAARLDGKQHWYGQKFYLDIEEIERLAEYRYKTPTSHEFADMVKGLPEKQVKEIADAIWKKSHQARIAEEMRIFLRKLDEDPRGTINRMNAALAAHVVRPSDVQYEDFKMPEFNIINAGRYSSTIREISLEEKEGKLVQIKGWLTYVQDPIPERIVEAEWMHAGDAPRTREFCGELFIMKGSEKPESCPRCKGRDRFVINSKTTEKFQECILTENFEDSSGFPTSIKMVLTGSQTGSFAPGDRVIVVSTVDAEEIILKSGQILYNHVLNAISIRKVDDRSVNLTAEDRKQIADFVSANSNPLEALVQRFAPHIIGHDHIKKALILQAAGSPDEGNGAIRKRGQIHVLLVGDPGLGKSQLLRAVSTLAPKALYVTDASAAGLTAAVTDVAGKKVMVAGVLVLADGGIAAIDELDKMKAEDREGIHTAMEQGFISKSKAGVHANFQTRTSVLAAANPKLGRFDTQKSIAEQITLEAPLLNRFDLIFILLDTVASQSYETQRARQMLEGLSPGDDDFLRKYISMSHEVDPELSADIMEKIADYYSSIRKLNTDATVNPRTLDALKRLTKASARIRLSSVANDVDFENAKELVESYLRQFAYDLDAISGITSSLRNLIYAMKDFVAMKKIASTFEIMDELERLGADKSKANRIIDEMHRNGMIYSMPNDRWGFVE